MTFWKIAKRELKRHLTVMLIPHNSIRPIRLTFSFSFLLLLIGSWTGVTLWAGYWASRNIDYLKIETDHKLMRLKVMFFAQEIKKSQEMLEQVKENDQQLRALLQMKSKKAIIETSEGKGGPSKEDEEDLKLLLSGRVYEMTQQEMHRQAVSLQEATQQRINSFNEITNYIDNERVLYRATPNIWPCLGHVTSPFGFRIHPIYESNEFHSGIDIANAPDTTIHAVADGMVRVCGWQPGYGRLIVIDHGHGYRTYYGHLNKLVAKSGEHVRRGQVIGLMGNTGTSTGPHLHYEIQYRGHPVNPVKFLKKIRPVLAKTSI